MATSGGEREERQAWTHDRNIIIFLNFLNLRVLNEKQKLQYSL